MGIIKIIKGDITKIKADVIVNAANSSLMGGGGVDGAIHRAGGKDILKECLKIGYCKTGEAVITTAGLLDAKYVIHTVGPVWKGGSNNEDSLLEDCYLSTLDLSAKHNCKSVAIPNISTGVYGFPKERAAKIAIKTVLKFLNGNNTIEEVIFVCFDEDNYRIYRNLIHLRSDSDV